MKWTKFKDGPPPSQEQMEFYVTNFEEVWTWSETFPKHWEIYGNANPEEAWSDIPIPEVPKEEEGHRCTNKNSECYYENEGLRLRTESSAPGFFINIPVYFCPFCGYEAKK